MDKTTYKIKDFSNSALCAILIPIWFVVLVGFNLLLMKIYDDPFLPLISIALFAVIIIVIILMLFKNVLVEISISEKYMGIVWLKKPYLSRKQNQKIYWGNIKNYVFEEYNSNETFKLIHKDNKRFKLSHRNSYNKDNFMEFKEDFQNMIKSINLERSKDIEVGKTIYEGVSGFIFAVIIIVVMTGLIILTKLCPTILLS